VVTKTPLKEPFSAIYIDHPPSFSLFCIHFLVQNSEKEGGWSIKNTKTAFFYSITVAGAALEWLFAYKKQSNAPASRLTLSFYTQGT